MSSNNQRGNGSIREGRGNPRREVLYDPHTLGEGEYGTTSSNRNKLSQDNKLRMIIRQLREVNTALEADYRKIKNESQHYQVGGKRLKRHM